MSEPQNMFVNLFSEYPLDHPDFLQHLIKAFEKSFQGSSDLDHTEHILTDFFQNIPFDFSEFLRNYPLTDNSKKGFFIDVLYGLYFGEIKLSSLKHQDQVFNLEFVLLRVLATRIEEKKLKEIWQQLSAEKKLRLICFAFLDLREGSHAFIHLLENDPDYRELVLGLKSRYLDINKFHQLINSNEDVASKIKEYAREQTTEFYHLFRELVGLMQAFPFNIHKELQDRLTYFCAQDFTVEDFSTFAKYFGLEGHIPFLKNREGICEEKTLVEKFRIVNTVFKNPKSVLEIDQKNVIAITFFVLTVIDHLDALKNHPHKYKDGIEKLSFGMATCGKKLSKTSSLSSLLKGLKQIETITQSSFLNTTPIFVFDQSDDSLFYENQAYIDTLNRKFNSSIVHISKNEALSIAKLLQVEPLLNTTETGNFGYGGARNCIYLLAPLLKMAWKDSFKAITELDQSVLKKYFSQVLEESHAIFMFDDDLEIAAANILSDALLVQTKRVPHYLSYTIGRNTKFGNQFIDLNRFFSKPQDNFLSTQWMSCPIGAGMSELVTPSFFCLNLPFGAEEGHFDRKDNYNALLQPSFHLAGTRYPSQEIPTRFFIGMENHLKQFIPMAIHLDLSNTLLDSLNNNGVCALPWNDENTACPQNNLRAIFEYVSSPQVAREMQNRFWRNVDMYLLKQSKTCTYLESIKSLCECDVENVVASYIDVNTLNEIEKKSLQAIQAIYQMYKYDAGYVLEYLELVTKQLKFDNLDNVEKILEDVRHDMQERYQIRFIDYPLLQGLYLIFKAIGAQQFNVRVEAIFQSQHS